MVIVAFPALYISTPVELISAYASPIRGEANVADDALDSHITGAPDPLSLMMSHSEIDVGFEPRRCLHDRSRT